MNKFLRDIIEQQQPEKLTRQAFVYFEPKQPIEQFAQCGTCRLFLPTKQRCSIFPNNQKVIAQGSCSLYIQGQPNDQQPIVPVITAEQAGYVEQQVRCENCGAFQDNKCWLFEQLNKKMPDTFDLDVNVSANGCCNGWAS